MRLLLILVATAISCDVLFLPPCDVSIKTCYIHSNVCSATDVLFLGLGTGWTYRFVLYDVVPGTRCNQTASVLSQYCTSPAPSVQYTVIPFVIRLLSVN